MVSQRGEMNWHCMSSPVLKLATPRSVDGIGDAGRVPLACFIDPSLARLCHRAGLETSGSDIPMQQRPPSMLHTIGWRVLLQVGWGSC
jgi:hypothetical protein